MDKRGRIKVIIGVLAILLVSISLILFVSSDLGNTKVYEEITKTATIKDGSNADIASVTLNTPQDYHVGAGYQRVAEFTISPNQNYNDILGNFEFYDLRDGNKAIQKTIDIKYLTTEQVSVDDFTTECSNVFDEVNGTTHKVCNQVVSGSHFENRDVWVDFDNSVKTNEEITIGLFTNVEIGDRIEWIPTIAGVKISEWAIWTQSLNVDLVLYYNCNDADEEISHMANITNKEGTMAYNSTNALIGNACQFALDQNAEIKNSTTNYTNLGIANRSWNFWFRPENSAEEPMVFTQYTDNIPQFQIYQSKFYLYDISNTPYDTAPISDGNWQMLTFINNGTGMQIWINSTMVQYAGVGTSWINGTLNLGTVISGAGFDYKGQMDEIGFWTRTLNSSEITQLWNDGNGITYTNDFGNTNYTLTFNLTDSITEQQISTSGPNNHFDLSCNNGYNVIDVENPHTTNNTFSGIVECTFSGLNQDTYFSKTQNITADSNKTVEIQMSQSDGLTQEEHDWLEAVYGCVINGTGCAP